MELSPYSSIFITSKWIIAISGACVHVLNLATGEIISSKSIESGGHTQPRTTSKGPIVAAAVNEESTYLLTVGENKILTVWQLPNLESVNERELPKRPTGLAFTKDSQAILVSDKFGDVFSYALNYVPSTPRPARDDFSSHENPSDGQLVLGHASPLNAFLLSHDEKYIITADRDEHIRVSWYPQGYNIEMYCLGHRKYVSAIHIPTFAKDVLISGGGDPSLKIWSWMSGKCTAEIQIRDVVVPFAAVKRSLRECGEDEQDSEGESTQKRKGKGKKSKKRVAKRAAQAKKGNAAEQEEKEEEDSTNEDQEAQYKEDQVAEAVEEVVLVVSKIGTVQRGDAKYVIFSVVGVTALFGFLFPTGSIIHLDLDHPIINFTNDTNGKIWVSLDTRRTAQGKVLKASPPVRVVEFDESGKLVEITSTENQAPLNSLKEKAYSEYDRKALDFYADLKGMPKWSESSSKVAATEDDDTTGSVSSVATSKLSTRRQEARMKNKKNVLIRMQKMGDHSEKEKPGTVRSFEDVEADDAEEGREQKRARSDVEGSGDVIDMDIHS